MEDEGTMASKWRNIGTALGLRQDVLESIRRTEQSNADDQNAYRVAKEELWHTEIWHAYMEEIGRAIKARTGGSDTALAQRMAEKHFCKETAYCMHASFLHGKGNHAP